MRRARGPLFVLSTLLVATACGTPAETASEPVMYRTASLEAATIETDAMTLPWAVADLPSPPSLDLPVPAGLWVDVRDGVATFVGLEAERVEAERVAATAAAEAERRAVEARAAEAHAEEHRADAARAEESRIANRESGIAEVETAPAPAAAPEPSGGGTDAIPAHVIACESGGSYTAQNPRSSASGKYQMIDSTFQGTKAGGASGYRSAKDAPPAVQDAAAAEVWDGGRGARNWAACL